MGAVPDVSGASRESTMGSITYAELAAWSLLTWTLIADWLALAFERVHCLKFIRIRNKAAVVIAMVLITSHKDY